MSFKEVLEIVNVVTSITGNVALIAFFLLRERVVTLEVKQRYWEEFIHEIKKDFKEIKELITQIRIEK